MCYIPGDAWDFKVDASYSRIDPTELEIPHEIIHPSFLIRSELIHKNPSITQKKVRQNRSCFAILVGSILPRLEP